MKTISILLSLLVILVFLLAACGGDEATEAPADVPEEAEDRPPDHERGYQQQEPVQDNGGLFHTFRPVDKTPPALSRW